ncbi:AAA family ATPase [Vibrio sp. 1978]|uniref:AAA family ATPase n=1 Tax=Vibrio sp. 1978 TaxID=3074585 RepID=UPI00296610D9|nr:AAA family ATPase [Vibrio sp. 1978]MDW3057867.1 AAA family ATPase [Vibrio sp. 1978]
MSNFNFLTDISPELAQFGKSAELYCYDDKQVVLVKLRCFTELVVGEIYSRLSLTPPVRDDLYNRLRSYEFKDVVSDKGIWAKLDVLRHKGNKAAHSSNGSDDISLNETLWLIKEAYLVARWYAQAILNQPITPPEFVDPVKPIDQTSRLEAELERQRQELNKREAELKTQLADNSDKYQQQTNELIAQLDEKNDTLSNVKKEQALLQIELEQKQKDLVASQQAFFDYRTREEFKQASISSASSFDLDMEVTRRNIDIFDCFEGVSLTKGQNQIVKQINEFLTDTKQNVFLLNGYAGTGKTFITKGFTQYLERIGREFAIMAPTGKAAKVISDKTMQPASTIHRVIYNYDNVKEYKVDGVEGSETYRCYADLKVNVDTAEAVYIIDEASMVSDRYSDGEFFRFGSGYLLKDLLKYINIDHNDHNKKVIFIGDNAQLPPVGMNTSPALDASYLKENYQVAVASGYLTEVVRQKGDSGVLNNAAMLRDGLEQNLFNKLKFEVNDHDVFNLSSENLLSTYLDSCDRKVSRTGESIIIASSNRQVAEYNRLVREYFFTGQQQMVAGDKVISVANHYRADACITNGEFGMIKEVLSPHSELISVVISVKGDTGDMVKRKVNLSFRDVILGFRNDYGEPFFFEAKIVENLLYNDQPTLSSDEHKALYVHFLNRHPELRRKGNEQKLRIALLQDPYFNAFKIKFGYSITGHKAQGSEWKTVFLQCQTHQKALTKDYFRWLYTAITRTSGILYVMNPPQLRLGDGMKIAGVYQPKAVDLNNSVPQGVEVVRPSTEATNSVTTVKFDFQTDIPQLKKLYQLVHACIEGTGITVVDVLHYNYQDRYILQRGNEQASISFNYKGNWKVSGVKSIAQDGFDVELMALLGQLEGTLLDVPESSKDTQFHFSEPFLEEFYLNVLGQISSVGADISKIESRSFCERYAFVKGNELAVIEFWYNKSSQFTKVQPMPQLSNSTRLIDEIICQIGVLL